MPAPATVAEFVDVIRKSGLVPDDRLQAEVHRPRLAAAPTVDAAAQAFVDAGLLSRFQSKQLKLGRYKRFEIASKYRLLELLGVGGMGAVYLCEHMFMKRLVALKVLPVEKLHDPSALLRFYREARAVAALDHPNIVRAYDIDKFEQMHFLVMEYVDGASVQEIVARRGRLDPMRAANYVAQSAHGLHHAHQLGMVHRDIKPGNLLLERTGLIKILDMGLARFFDQKTDNVTERFDNNCVLGTADYLAPEQAVSNVVDIRADIYALGGTFYYMLTGQSPFPDGTIAHKLMCHQRETPKPVGSFRADVPPELLAVLDRMMRKDPDERYQTPKELFDALAEIVEETPVPPPLNEMPDLCPLVLNLAGHAGDKARTNAARLAPARLSAGPPSGGSAGSPSSQILGRAGGPVPSGTALQDFAAGGSSAALPASHVRGGPSPSTSPLTAKGSPTDVSDTTPVPARRLAPGAGPAAARKLQLYLMVGVAGGVVMAVVAGAAVVAVWLAVR